MPSIDTHDPFSEVLRPPKHETLSEKASRERREADAKDVSDRIDEELRQERARLKKERDIVKVLLLGQSESGKSTTLKNFRLTYSRSEWDAEKTSWRTVIQLNLIRSINTILDTLQAEINGDPIGRGAAVRQPTTPSASPKNRTKGLLSDLDEADTDPRRPKSPHSQMTFNEDSPTHFDGNSEPKSNELTHQLRTQVTQLRLRLSPLRQVEMDLRRQLGAGTEEVTEAGIARGILPPNGYQTETDADAVVGRRDHNTTTEVNNNAARAVTGERESRARRVRGPGDEVFVKGWHWREMMRMAQAGSNVRNGFDLLNGGSARNSHAEDATEVIWRLKSDMKLLWTDEQVREILRRRDVVLENNGGFFLDDIDRIATRSYEPSDDDVVRARLRTLGVQEYRIVFESLAAQKGILADPGREWIIYDVGGSRTVRRAWVPYFENITAIIFLAPISCFDERLLEDSNVNRLEDSVSIWRAICSTKLLSKTTMICFLNKCDILKRKLDSGTRFKTYVPIFGERENSAGVVVKFLRNRFKDIHTKHSPEKRNAYIYATTVTDTTTTAATLTNVRDSVLQEHLRRADVM